MEVVERVGFGGMREYLKLGFLDVGEIGFKIDDATDVEGVRIKMLFE